MQSKIKKIIITVIVLCAIGIPAGKHWYNNHAIQFKDENMKRLIASLCYKPYSEDLKITPKDMEKVVNLDIGYAGYYDTLEDLKWCTNLKSLLINGKPGEYGYVYKVFKGKVPEGVTEEKVNQFEKELGEILPKLTRLKKVRIVSKYGCHWNSLDFLEGCNQIEELWMDEFAVDDYSVLKRCKSIKKIIIFNSSIKYAEDMIELEHLEWIGLVNTPLSDNPKEIKKIKETYPNIKFEY